MADVDALEEVLGADSAGVDDVESKENESAPAAQEVVDESDAKLPAPLSNGAYRQILKELPDGPRVAAETCVQFWKDKKFPTEELVAFLKTISVHSPTLKKGFDDQHNGFLRAMKLQEEQQRKREEEEMARRHPAALCNPQWLHNYPAHMMMDSAWGQRAMYMGMGDLARYPGVLGASVHYAMAHEMYQGGMSEYGLHEAGALGHGFSSFMGQEMGGDGPRMGQRRHAAAQHRAAAGDGMAAINMIGPGAPGAAGMRGQGFGEGLAASRSQMKRGREEVADEDEGVARLPSDGSRRRVDALCSAPSPYSAIPPVTDADLGAARTALNGKFPRDLIRHELGDWLTERAHAITSAVFVKVVADVRRRVVCDRERPDECIRKEPGDEGSHAQADAPMGKDADVRSSTQRYYYRRKAILAFRCLPGSVGDALTFGMYVHEYGADAPAWYRGKVMLECIDGTPLFNGETADERQRCLSAIAQAYMEFAAKQGFTEILLRVPPPSDCDAHLFSPRSRQVQLKASEHLCQWYRRLMEYGVRAGTIREYKSSRDGRGDMFPLSILSRRDASCELDFKATCDELAERDDGSSHPLTLLAASDRFFEASLCSPQDCFKSGGADLGSSLPLIECPLAANRHRFTTFCKQKRLYFHSIEHAQYSTMILQNEFLRQRCLPPDALPLPEDEADEEWTHESLAGDREDLMMAHGKEAQQDRPEGVASRAGDGPASARDVASSGAGCALGDSADGVGASEGRHEYWGDELSSLGGPMDTPGAGDTSAPGHGKKT